jgi:hypothetical protein
VIRTFACRRRAGALLAIRVRSGQQRLKGVDPLVPEAFVGAQPGGGVLNHMVEDTFRALGNSRSVLTSGCRTTPDEYAAQVCTASWRSGNSIGRPGPRSYGGRHVRHPVRAARRCPPARAGGRVRGASRSLTLSQHQQNPRGRVCPAFPGAVLARSDHAVWRPPAYRFPPSLKPDVEAHQPWRNVSSCAPRRT